MSIIRVGLAETKNFSDGYDRIFGKKEGQEQSKDEKAEQDKEKAQEQTPEKK